MNVTVIDQNNVNIAVTPTPTQTITIDRGIIGISGLSGYSGYSGYSGISGWSGISGYSGSGISGWSGYSGYSGISGQDGASGFSGISGWSGISGYSGSGVSGYSGYSGSGVSGYSGFSGYSGYSGAVGAGGTIGFWGSFWDTTTQTTTINTPTAITFNSYDVDSTGVSIGSPTSRIVFANSGTYSLTFSIQFTNTSTANGSTQVWLKKNGTNIPDTNSHYDVPDKQGSAFSSEILTVNFVFEITANDYVEIYWDTANASVSLETIAGNGTYPRTPSVIFTATQVMYGQSGYSGYSGISGFSGISGWSGISGYSGSGVSGYSGYSGISGYSGTTPTIGGSNTQVQYNNSGVLGGSANFVFDGTNVGIGIIPSTWNSGTENSLQVKYASIYSYSNYEAGYSVNANYNTGWKYIASTSATQYKQTNGEHQWLSASAGTAGNAITFTQAMTLDASGNLSLGSTSNASRLDVTGTDNTNTTLASRVYSANRTAFLGFGFGVISASANSTGLFLEALGANPMAFSTNATEKMRITSAGDVGIGTSSPSSSRVYIANIGNANSGSYKITQRSALTLEDDTVNTNGPTVLTIAGNQAGASPTNSARISLWGQGYTGVSTEASRIDLITSQGSASTNVNGNLTFSTSSNSTTPTERMRITSTGDVGIGTTSLDLVGSTTSLTLDKTSGNGQLSLAANGTVRGRIFADNSSSELRIGNPTSNPVTFFTANTERMRIDSSGNVGIGNTPTAKLDVTSGDGTATANGFYVRGATGVFALYPHYDATLGCLINSFNSAISAYKPMTFQASSFVWNPNGTERMTITSAGDVGIGRSSPSSKLDIATAALGKALQLSDDTNYGATFTGISGGLKLEMNGTQIFTINQVGNGERLRIDSSGNVLMGTTNTDVITNKISAATVTPSTTCFRVYSDVSNACAIGVTSTGAALVSWYYNGANFVGSVTTNGTGVTYGTASDYRLKENVASMTGALAKVAQLKPVTYKWKSDGSDGQGFIAHELQAVVPDCVNGEKDAVDEDGNIKPQSVDTSFLVATLVSAIQEQQALIELLTTRLIALENK